MIETCRICLDQDLSTNLVAPCKCAGTQRYVHPNCLGRWQQTMLDSILENPETLSPERVEKCYVCKTRYINYKRTFGRLFKRQFKRVFTSYILLFVATGLLVLLFIPLILNLIAIIAICVLLCYWKEVRPSIFLTSDGIKFKLIRVGLQQPNITVGTLLEATELLNYGIFQNTRVMLTRYSPDEGATGFILNKISCNIYTDNHENILRIGGPVRMSVPHVLHDISNIHGTHIVNGIYVGGQLNPIPRQSQTILLYGHASWSSLQIDGEVAQGLWREVGMASPELIFTYNQELQI